MGGKFTVRGGEFTARGGYLVARHEGHASGLVTKGYRQVARSVFLAPKLPGALVLWECSIFVTLSRLATQKCHIFVTLSRFPPQRV